MIIAVIAVILVCHTKKVKSNDLFTLFVYLQKTIGELKQTMTKQLPDFIP